LLTPPVKLLALLNAIASSVDILNLLLVLMQVPQNAILKKTGQKPIGETKGRGKI
jgi:hypothetical protein